MKVKEIAPGSVFVIREATDYPCLLIGPGMYAEMIRDQDGRLLIHVEPDAGEIGPCRVLDLEEVKRLYNKNTHQVELWKDSILEEAMNGMKAMIERHLWGIDSRVRKDGGDVQVAQKLIEDAKPIIRITEVIEGLWSEIRKRLGDENGKG